MSQDQSLSANHHQAGDARKAVLGVCLQLAFRRERCSLARDGVFRALILIRS